MQSTTDNVYSAFGPKLSFPGLLDFLLILAELSGMYISNRFVNPYLIPKFPFSC